MKYQLADKQVTLLGSGHYIAPTAAVIGNVTLGERSSVWFSSVIRGDAERIEVGAGANIQDGAVLHADPGFPCVVGDNVTVGHNAMLHGCEVGEGTLVGISAVVLNGAKIGKRCLIASCAMVPEGMEIPDGAMVVGVPAKIKRILEPDQQVMLEKNAQHYQLNAARFETDLKEQD